MRDAAPPPEEDIIKSAVWAWEAEYGSAVLQSGERSDPQFVDMVERIIKEIKRRTNGELGLTLSLGEQTEEILAELEKAAK